MGASNPILDLDQLHAVVDEFRGYDEFIVDVETRGQWRLDPRRNEVFWVTLASHGARVEVIPFGHPNGEEIGIKLEPRQDKNGKIRNFKVPDFSPPPVQLATADVMSALKPLFWSDARKVGHNVKFDIESLAKYWGELPPGPYGDIEILAYLLNENYKKYRLGDILEREFGVTYDKTVGWELEKHSFSKAAGYCQHDGWYEWMLWRYFYPQVEDGGYGGLRDLDFDMLRVLAGMEQIGVPLDVETTRELDRVLDRRLVELRRELYEIVGHEWNMNSVPQKQKVFYGKRSEGGRGLHPTKLTATGAPSCDDEALREHEGDELVDAYIEYGDVFKVSNTYVKAYLGDPNRKITNKNRNNAPALAEDGRIHPNFRLAKTVTGRLSCSEPNLQNIPRPDTELGKQIRSLFIAPPGHKLIVADYKQIEYVVLAHYSGDPTLIRFFEEGKDFHLAVAAMILGKPESEVTKPERTICKNTNFACVPMDTQALTRRGWVGYDELRIGDKVLSYDGKAMRWTPVLEKLRYDDALLVELSVGKSWSVRCTPNHRWDVVRRRGGRNTRHHERMFRQAQQLDSEDVITTGAWADTKSCTDITPDEAELLAWVYCDGQHVRQPYVGAPAQAGGRLTGFQVKVFQSVSKFAVEIDGLLKDVGCRYLRSKPTSKGIITWTIDASYARDLWTRARLWERSLEQLVLDFDTLQRAAFLNGALLAEGHRSSTGQWHFTQCEGEVLEAFKLCALLEGYQTRTYRKAPTRYTRTPCYDITLGDPRVTAQKLKRVAAGNESVWCIRTKYENWVMRQGDVITLTGNTIYGAGDERVAHMSGISVQAAKRFRAAHKKMLPAVYAFCDNVVWAARKRRPPYVHTTLGRKRRLPAIHYSNDKLRLGAERQAVNHVIQGTAAEINKVGAVRLDEMLEPGHDLVLTVHDEFVIIVPDDEVERAIPVVETAMIGDGVQELLRVPLGVDIQAVSRWSDAKE